MPTSESYAAVGDVERTFVVVALAAAGWIGLTAIGDTLEQSRAL